MRPDLRASFATYGYPHMKYGLDAAGPEVIPAVLRRWNGDSSLNELVQWMSYFPRGFHSVLVAWPDHAVSIGKGHAGSLPTRDSTAGDSLSASTRTAPSPGLRPRLRTSSTPVLGSQATAMSVLGVCAPSLGVGAIRCAAQLRRFGGLAGAVRWHVAGACIVVHAPPGIRHVGQALLRCEGAQARRYRRRRRRLAARVPTLQMWWLQDEIPLRTGDASGRACLAVPRHVDRESPSADALPS